MVVWVRVWGAVLSVTDVSKICVDFCESLCGM